MTRRENVFYSGSLGNAGKRRYKCPSKTFPLDPLKILTFTWNVGNAQPAVAELEHWCPEGGADLDIIAVGTQENYFKETNDVTDTKELDVDDDAKVDEVAHHDVHLSDKFHRGNKRTTAWDKMVAQRLGAKYFVVRHVVLWEMRLTVYAKVSSKRYIFGVESASSATGVAGVLGNKGGLVVKLNVGHTAICFVSCHLAAHSHHLDKRNLNCKEILHETRRAIGSAELDVSSEFDHVFWMGDLNYRVDLVHYDKNCETLNETEHLARVKEMIAREDWDGLMKCDQLAAQQQMGAALFGFTEGTYNFAPTFKVSRAAGMNHKDQRIPSYCDRILWKSMLNDGKLKQISLRSVPEVSTSDHKPVVSIFELAPSQGLVCTPDQSIIIRMSGVRVRGLVDADLTGGSDPYLIFLTNPAEVLSEHKYAPISAIKKVASSTTSPQHSVHHSVQQAVAKHLPVSHSFLSEVATWTEKELPLLRPLVKAEDLHKVVLIIAIFDHDVVGSDDFLGVVHVPLRRPEGAIGQLLRTPDLGSCECLCLAVVANESLPISAKESLPAKGCFC